MSHPHKPTPRRTLIRRLCSAACEVSGLSEHICKVDCASFAETPVPLLSQFPCLAPHRQREGDSAPVRLICKYSSTESMPRPFITAVTSSSRYFLVNIALCSGEPGLMTALQAFEKAEAVLRWSISGLWPASA